MENNNAPKEYPVKRIGGYLHRIVPILDNTGKVVSYALKPLMVELHVRDIMQIIVGSIILAIPVGFTEEVWVLSETLPAKNIFFIALFSVFFISVFVYHNFYKDHTNGFGLEFIKRIFAIYLISGVMVALFLTLIGQCPWGIDNILALKKIIIVTLPASMSATLSDMIK